MDTQRFAEIVARSETDLRGLESRVGLMAPTADTLVLVLRHTAGILAALRSGVLVSSS